MLTSRYQPRATIGGAEQGSRTLLATNQPVYSAHKTDPSASANNGQHADATPSARSKEICDPYCKGSLHERELVVKLMNPYQLPGGG